MKKTIRSFSKTIRSLFSKRYEVFPEKGIKNDTKFIFKTIRYIRLYSPYVRTNLLLEINQYMKIPSEVLALGLGFKAGLKRCKIVSGCAKCPAIRPGSITCPESRT